jgi:hypothetical protein
MVPPIERSSAIVIDRLSSGSLSRLCQALEALAVLPPAPGSLSRAGKNTYLLDGLQHPKVHKLIQDTSNGPQIDIQVFTVNELKALARQLQAPFRSSDRKQAIVDSIISNLTGVQSVTKQLLWQNLEE